MFSKIRSLARQSAVYGVGTIAARAVAFLLLPYYSHLMSPGEYGVYTLFLIMVSFLQPVYVHGMDIALLRFSATAEEMKRKRQLGNVLVQTLLVGGAVSALVVCFAPAVSRVVVSTAGPNEVLITRIGAVILLADTLNYHLFTFLRIQHRAVAFSIVKLLNVFINIGLNIFFVGTLHMGALGAFYAFLLTALLSLLVLLVMLARHIVPSWRWSRVREWLAFGLPNLPSMLFVIAIEFSDRKWIEALLGVEEAGIYAAGYRIGMLMSMVAQAFRFAWQPFFLQTAKDDDARETFARVLTYFLLFAGWIWLAATLLLEPLLKVPLPGIGPLINERYWAGLRVFPIVMFAHIFDGVFANFMVGIYLKKKTKVIPLVIGIAAVVNIVGNGLLIPVYGYMASAWLTVVSYAIIAVGIFLYIQPRYHVPYEWGRIGRIALTIGAAWGVGIVFTPHGGWIVGIILVAAVPLIWWHYVLEDGERRALVNRFRRAGR